MIQTASMVLRNGTALLADAIGEGAARDARILMAHILGIPSERLTIELPRAVTPVQVAQFEHLVHRRTRLEPISHIIGKRFFWNREFHVTKDVLDPRPETETLVELSLRGPAPLSILDLGTGCGCILLSLLDHWPDARGLGTDNSIEALNVANRNAQSLDLADRVTFQVSDWLSGLSGRFDLIVSNPPYISAPEMNDLSTGVRDFEPHNALTSGGDGLGAYRTIAANLRDFLTPNGRAVFEFGHNQANAVSEIFARVGFRNTIVHRDLNTHERIITINGVQF